MERNWGYLLRSNIAPVWLGEFGVAHGSSDGEKHYWKNLMKYMRSTDVDWGYWALNPRKPEAYDNETYGLLADDWKTVVTDWRYQDLMQLTEQLV